MKKDPKTYGEALTICKKYFLDDMCPRESPFKIAKALLCAQGDGSKEQVLKRRY